MATRQRLDEFRGVGNSLDMVVTALSGIMGRFQRVGSDKRVYLIGQNQRGAVFTVGSGVEGIGLGWSDSNANVRTVYYWQHVDLSKEPDYEVNLPNIPFTVNIAAQVVNMIREQVMGEVELHS
jgi:hypothetical protein